MSRASRGIRITGRVIKYLFFTLVFAVIILLLWRIFSSGDPKEMKRLTPNDKLCAAYEEKGDELTIFRQEQKSITSGKDNYGYFSVTQCVFIPDANQIQIVVRYNNSTLRALAEDFGLPEAPARDAELFDISLTVAVDKTPDVTEDNAGNDTQSVAFTRIHPTTVEAGEKNLYNYRRLVFDLDSEGLSLHSLLQENLLLAVYADIYYNQAINYEEHAYGTLCLYDYVSEKIEVNLTSADRKALESYGE